MPLYEYRCPNCEVQVELLVRSFDEPVECPQCGSPKMERLLSVAAAPAIASKALPVAPTCGRSECSSGRCAFEA